jgi:hypothetical protein
MPHIVNRERRQWCEAHAFSVSWCVVVPKVERQPLPCADSLSSYSGSTRVYCTPCSSRSATNAGHAAAMRAYTSWLRQMGVWPPSAGGTSQWKKRWDGYEGTCAPVGEGVGGQEPKWGTAFQRGRQSSRQSSILLGHLIPALQSMTSEACKSSIIDVSIMLLYHQNARAHATP